MVMDLTPSLEETSVQGIDMKCFLVGSSIRYVLLPFYILTFRRFKMSSIIFKRLKFKEQS